MLLLWITFIISLCFHPFIVFLSHKCFVELILVTLLSIVYPFDPIMTLCKIDVITCPWHILLLSCWIAFHASEFGIIGSLFELHFIGVSSHMYWQCWMYFIGRLKSRILIPVLRHWKLSAYLSFWSKQVLLVMRWLWWCNSCWQSVSLEHVEWVVQIFLV